MKRAVLLALILMSTALALFSAWAEDLALTPQRGMLLLNNGELIEGTITTAGDRYDVTLADGEIHIKRSQVAYLGRDKQTCYQHKLHAIEGGRAQEHLDLAEWCLRHAMLDEATAEITTAKTADPAHPKIRLLETRLSLARENLAPREAAKDAGKSAATEPLDMMVRNLPPGTVETFTNEIQPLLLNYCTKSGCHGAQSTAGLRIERIPPNRHAGRKPTQRNLQTALAMIDRENPEESKLLKTPIRAHGSSTMPVFTDREQAQYRKLVEWVYLVAGGKQQAATPPSLEERTAPLRQTVSRRGRNMPEPAAKTQSKLDNAKAKWSDWPAGLPEHAKDGADVDGDDSQSHPAESPQSDEPPVEFTPKDPFDPEIFNRKFLKK